MSVKFKINPKIKLHTSKRPTAMHVETVNSVINPISMSPGLPSMETYEKMLAEAKEGLFDSKMDSMTKFYAVSAYSAIYAKASSGLKGVIKDIDSIRNFYLVDVMLAQLTSDALSPTSGSEELIRYSHPDKTIQKELDDLKKRIGLDQLILNITPDLCAYGEYTLKTRIDGETVQEYQDALGNGEVVRTKKNGEGVLDISDCVEQGSVISLTQDGKNSGYLVLNDFNGQIEYRSLASFVKFQLGGSKIKVDLQKHIPKSAFRNKKTAELLSKIPRFIRIGKSVLHPVRSKIKELELMEKLVPATRLNQLTQGNLVGLPLPPGTSLQDAKAAARQVEALINKKVSIDPEIGEITVEKIISTAGKTRVIPQMGEGGGLEKFDYKSEDPTNLMNEAKEMRESILDSIGMPSELIYKSESESKAEFLKRYNKYQRILKNIQKAIVEGCKQIAFIHLANKGYQFVEEEVEVQFVNALVDLDNLDKSEFADVTIAHLTTIRDFFNQMVEADSPYRGMVNLGKVAEYFDTQLTTIGLSDAINLPSEGGEEPNPEAVDVDGDDDGSAPPQKEAPVKKEPKKEEPEEEPKKKDESAKPRRRRRR